MKFNYRTPVNELWGSYIDAKPRDYDWTEGWTETWDFWEGRETECPHCEHVFDFATNSETTCPKCDTEFDAEFPGGPMMNYYYPVDVGRVGGAEYAALAIAHLPLCVIEWQDGWEGTGDYALALTGGGMDLSWEIIEAYMRLGYLPPFHFIAPPAMAGKRLDARHKWLLAGCNATLRLWEMRIATARRDVRYLRQTLKERTYD